MTDFYKTITYLSSLIYEPNNLVLKQLQEEKQNSKYGAGSFQIASKTVRFRVAKLTPTKLGQFVVFWEKNQQNKNQPYSYKNATDLLVITTFKADNGLGQFIFPKELLVKQGILQSNSIKGKMALRVYPPWDSPTSKQAIKTQAWQLPYFIDMSDPQALPHTKIVEYYSK